MKTHGDRSDKLAQISWLFCKNKLAHFPLQKEKNVEAKRITTKKTFNNENQSSANFD